MTTVHQVANSPYILLCRCLFALGFDGAVRLLADMQQELCNETGVLPTPGTRSPPLSHACARSSHFTVTVPLARYENSRLPSHCQRATFPTWKSVSNTERKKLRRE